VLISRCGGSVVGDVVAQLLGMWWLSCWGCGGSVVGDVVAQLRECGCSVAGMWWLSWPVLECNLAVPGSIPASLTVS
jgi:hypothetical protein